MFYFTFTDNIRDTLIENKKVLHNFGFQVKILLLCGLIINLSKTVLRQVKECIDNENDSVSTNNISHTTRKVTETVCSTHFSEYEAP